MHCTKFRNDLQFLILVKRRGERERKEEREKEKKRERKKIIEKKMEERLIAIERETNKRKKKKRKKQSKGLIHLKRQEDKVGSSRPIIYLDLFISILRNGTQPLS